MVLLAVMLRSGAVRVSSLFVHLGGNLLALGAPCDASVHLSPCFGVAVWLTAFDEQNGTDCSLRYWDAEV